MSTDIKPADGAAILKAVEAQRTRLMDVLGVVQCIGIAVSDDAPRTPTELEGAAMLAERELQNVIEALEGPQLKRAATGGES